MKPISATSTKDRSRISPSMRSPSQTFKGTVTKVRLNASMTQNVVTYTVEIATDNSSGKLLPYLTANVDFEVDHRDDVLMVANAALRWTPEDEQVSPDAQQR